MSDFKGRHFRGEIVLWAVRWYCRWLSARSDSPLRQVCNRAISANVSQKSR